MRNLEWVATALQRLKLEYISHLQYYYFVSVSVGLPTKLATPALGTAWSRFGPQFGIWFRYPHDRGPTSAWAIACGSYASSRSSCRANRLES